MEVESAPAADLSELPPTSPVPAVTDSGSTSCAEIVVERIRTREVTINFGSAARACREAFAARAAPSARASSAAT